MYKFDDLDPVEEKLASNSKRLVLYRACKLVYPVANWLGMKQRRVELLALAATGKGTVRPEEVCKLIDALRRLAVWESKSREVRCLANMMATGMESWWGGVIAEKKMQISIENAERYLMNHAQIMEQRRKKRLGLPD